MSFLKNIFGRGSAGREKPVIEDDTLGTFNQLTGSGNNVTWKGIVHLMGATIAVYIHGEKDKLDEPQKKALTAMLANEANIEAEVDKALQGQYNNAGMEYVNWQTHFKCISITTAADGINVTMEQMNSFYHFNVFFEGNKAIDVSIDS